MFRLIIFQLTFIKAEQLNTSCAYRKEDKMGKTAKNNGKEYITSSANARKRLG